MIKKKQILFVVSAIVVVLSLAVYYIYNSQPSIEITDRTVPLHHDKYGDFEIILPYVSTNQQEHDNILNYLIETKASQIMDACVQSFKTETFFENTYLCHYNDGNILSFMFKINLYAYGAAYPSVKVFGLTIDAQNQEVLEFADIMGKSDWDTYINSKTPNILYGGLNAYSTDEFQECLQKWYDEADLHESDFYLTDKGPVLLFDLGHAYGDYGEVLLQE